MTLLLDTTVLVYAVGDASHPLAAPARAIVRRASTVAGYATTTPEVIQEFLHVRSRRRDREDAARLAVAFADLLMPLVLVSEADVRRGIELYGAHDALGACDASLAAVAIGRDGMELVSGDQGFRVVSGLPLVDLNTVDPT